MITQNNFYNGTSAWFKGCKPPKREPDYISYYYPNLCYGDIETKIPSSKYWYGENKNGKYVIRQSNHWCKVSDFEQKKDRDIKNIASCKWHLKSHNATNINKLRCGKAYFKNFVSLRDLSEFKKITNH